MVLHKFTVTTRADIFSPGLRTLCIASADVSEEFYQEWKGIYYTASTSIIDRERKIEEAGELIEKAGYELSS